MTAPWLPRALALVDAARDAPPDPHDANPTEETCEHARVVLRIMAEAGLPGPTTIDRSPSGLRLYWWMREGFRRRLVVDADNDGPDPDGAIGCVCFEWYEDGTSRSLFAGYHPDRLAQFVPAMRLLLGGDSAIAVHRALTEAGVSFLGWNPNECEWGRPALPHFDFSAYQAARERSLVEPPRCAPTTGVCLP